MTILEKAAQAIRFIGFRQALRTVLYALYRDREERKALREQPSPPKRLPERMISYQTCPGGLGIDFENGISLEVRFYSSGSVCLTWLPGTLPSPFIFGKEVKKVGLDNIKLMATRNTEDVEIQSLHLEGPACSLTISSDGSAEFFDTSGAVLCALEAPALNGTAWSFRKPFFEMEHVYGLGMRAANLNLRGGRFQFWNSDPGGTYAKGADPLYVTIPVFTSLHPGGSCMVFVENTHPGEMDLTGETLSARFDSGALRIHLIPGAPSEAIRSYTSLTGRPELPPRWALGFHQCRWGYQSEEDLRSVLAGFEKHDLPLQALHQDIDYMEGFRVFTVDRKRYPDLPGLTAEMAMRKIRFVPIIDPGIKNDNSFPLHNEAQEKGLLVRTANGKEDARAVVWPGWSVFPDFANSAARTWWSAQYNTLLDQGAAGIWHDMNEPAAISAWGDLTIAQNSVHNVNGHNTPHTEIHNIYGHLMNQAGYQGLRTARPNRRPWILSRSGWAGTQRYAWHWTADIESSWEALQMTIPMLLNLGLSGYAYSGPDIGGFSGNPDAELFTRWFQMASLLPLFRNHAAKGTNPREPWAYGQPYTKIIRNSMLLREKLMPYLYTLAWETSRTGAPLVRPLFWDHPDEPDLWAIDDAFLLGKDILVAPVLKPGEKLRRFSMPPGRWYYFWSEFCLEDTMFSELPVSLQRIPILVRGGAILPLDENGELALHIYPGPERHAQGQVYFDDEDGYGPSGTAIFEAVLTEEECIVSRKKAGTFDFPWKKIRPVLHGSDLEIRLKDWED